MSYYFYLAFAWIILGLIQLYRAYAGTVTGGVITLQHSQAPTLSNQQRWSRAIFGICHLGFAISYLVLYLRHAHHE